MTLAAIESDLNENREERFIAAFHTFTGLCYLLLASQLVFVKENPAPFRDKRRQMGKLPTRNHIGLLLPEIKNSSFHRKTRCFVFGQAS